MLRSWLYRLDTKASPYLYILPFFALFAALSAFPLLYTGWVSLHDWSLLEDEHAFLGAANYLTLLADPAFWNALFNTVSILVLSTVPQLLLALLLAHLLSGRLRGQTFWRLSLLLPNLTSVAAVAIIFGQLFGRDYGLVNWVLGVFGAGQIDWAAGTASSHAAISAMVIWRWTGYNALIYLAAMQAVPQSLHEAAIIDGASSLQRLRKITIPAIRPTIIFTVIVSTIGGMQMFAEPLLFGGGQPGGGNDHQFQTLTLYLFEAGFGRFDLGFASATAWVMFALVLVAAAVNYLLIRRIRST
ncbi:sugar ABC transporter permease [Nonomuraea sp. NPDC050310]|uniref:carbohydrate ABC transporter permease n=1 Tax=unclassified Nonomuraea TaxID=2593643 RepID=UPI0033D70B50